MAMTLVRWCYLVASIQRPVTEYVPNGGTICPSCQLALEMTGLELPRAVRVRSTEGAVRHCLCLTCGASFKAVERIDSTRQQQEAEAAATAAPKRSPVRTPRSKANRQPSR